MLHQRFDPDQIAALSPPRDVGTDEDGLGPALVRRGWLGAFDLMRLQAQARRHGLGFEDVLRASGLVSDTALADALAMQHGTQHIDLAALPPDRRLLDQLGAENCAQMHCLPWRRAGGVTVIASTAPRQFTRHRTTLHARFGAVAMVLVTPDALETCLAKHRGSLLRRNAEACVPAEESCRLWHTKQFQFRILAALALLAGAFLLAPTLSFLTLFGVVMLALLAGTGLKLAAALAQATRPHSDHEAIRPFRLPMISILVPLFHEPDIAPRLIKRLGALTYPRALLDVLLVVEADDIATRRALAQAPLPPWIRIVPVPPSPLRTKPKALNYEMNFARGSIIGVYDAEDAPSPDQLERVAQRFAVGGPDLACVQGILDYYNPTTNWLSRCFTIEYAAWFRVILPGMERLGLAVPLGGTTLFFQRSILQDLGGWDAHNVTEDADLGIRLARHGYRTELLATVTGEEANCRLWPWIKQRSRWLKGYAMTYAVHMRDPVTLFRQLGFKRFFGLQILLLGTLVQFLLAPLLWSFWLILFGLGHPVADTAPGWVMVATTLAFAMSELVSVAVNIAAIARSRHRALWPWVFSLQLYFPLAAIAAYKALYEMVRAPFFWDKTAHGLHDHAAAGAQTPHLARRRSPDSSFNRVSNAREICVRSA